MKMDDAKVHSHTWVGIFWFDVPVAIIVSIVYHGIVRDQLIDNLPDGLARRFNRIKGFRWSIYLKKHFVKILISFIVGISTHLLFDGLTHLNLAHPDDRTSKIYIGPVRLYILLQYATTAIGFCLITWYIYEQPKSSYILVSNTRPAFWTAIAGIAIVSIGIVLYLTRGTEKNIIGYLDVVISSLLIGLTVTAFVTGFRHIRKRILQLE